MKKTALFLFIALFALESGAEAQQAPSPARHDGRPGAGRPGGGSPPSANRPGRPQPGQKPGPGAGNAHRPPPRPNPTRPDPGRPHPGRPNPGRPETGRPPVRPPRPVHPPRPGSGHHGHRPGAGRPPHFRPVHAKRFYYPRGYAYRRWTIGLLLPRLFLSSRYYYDSYANLGIGAPPYGHRWVRYGPDLLLVDTRSGRVVDVIYGAFY